MTSSILATRASQQKEHISLVHLWIAQKERYSKRYSSYPTLFFTRRHSWTNWDLHLDFQSSFAAQSTWRIQELQSTSWEKWALETQFEKTPRTETRYGITTHRTLPFNITYPADWQKFLQMDNLWHFERYTTLWKIENLWTPMRVSECLKFAIGFNNSNPRNPTAEGQTLLRFWMSGEDMNHKQS